MNFTFWTPTQYEMHWRDAAERALRTSGAMFIASMTDPATSNFIMTWPCYRVGETVAFQQHILFLDELTEPFAPLSPHAHLPRREAETEDGERISEWSTSTTALRSFCRSS